MGLDSDDGSWARPPQALADPCQPSCSVRQLARWSHNRPCTRTLPRHKAFEGLLSEKCLTARPGLPGLCPLTWLWSVLSAQRGMTDRFARQPWAGRWVESSVGLVKPMGCVRRETEDGSSTAEPSYPLSLRRQRSRLACDAPGFTVPVGMENIPHTSTDYCNTSSPNPEGMYRVCYLCHLSPSSKWAHQDASWEVLRVFLKWTNK